MIILRVKRKMKASNLHLSITKGIFCILDYLTDKLMLLWYCYAQAYTKYIRTRFFFLYRVQFIVLFNLLYKALITTIHSIGKYFF